MAQTYIHTYGHGNSMTNSAQWGPVGEKRMFSQKFYPNQYNFTQFYACGACDKFYVCKHLFNI